MGLASKLQAAQGAANMVGAAMGGPPAAPYASAPPAPYPGQQQPGAPLGGNPPYGAGFGAPPPQQQQPGGMPGGPSPYPSPYPGAAPPGAPTAGAGAASAPPYPSPYPSNAGPGAAPGSAPGMPPSPYPSFPGAAAPTGYPGAAPGAPGQPQQRPPYPGAAPAPYPGAPGMMPQPQQMQQQQMMQQQQPPMGGPAGGMAASILAKLQSTATANQLQRFYTPQALQALAAKLDSRVNFRDLAARWRMPVELALDLSSLALYDIVLFADDSGSMAFEENGERIEDLKLIASKVAEIATLFDDDGILVRFMNSPTEGNAVRSAADVAGLLAAVQYSGLTPLATAMQNKVLQPIVYSLASSGQLAKPVLILTITDGEPTDNPRDLVVQVIKDSRNRLAAQYGPKAVAFEFAQVGKDSRAQAFLGRLDTDREVGSSIDCTSYFEMESAEYQKRGIQLSPEMWLVKMMVGSIDPSYDEGDE